MRSITAFLVYALICMIWIGGASEAEKRSDSLLKVWFWPVYLGKAIAADAMAHEANQ